MTPKIQKLAPRILAAGVLPLLALGPAYGVDFKKDVMPIFESSCFKCHGDGKSKAGVSLDEEKVAREIGDVIIPGDLEKSDLYQALIAEDKDDRMPPPGKGRTMSEKEITIIKEWILAGATIDGAAGDPPIAKEAQGEGMGPAPISGDWTNTEGRTITATLLRVEGETAVLRMAGDKIYNYPIANLSPESQAKVKEFAAKASQ